MNARCRFSGSELKLRAVIGKKPFRFRGLMLLAPTLRCRQHVDDNREVNVMDAALRGVWQMPLPATLDLRVEGPDVRGLNDTDIRRLFPDRLTGERLNRLRNWRRLVVRIDDRPVGVATYTQTPIETHVPDFAVVIPPSVEAQYENVAAQVLDSLLAAIEVASLAGGCHRVVLIPQGRAAELERRGYQCIHERCGGSWMEKSLP